MFEAIKEWIEDGGLKYPSHWPGIWHVRLFFTKLFKVLAYIPVLWNNEDFDHGYILKLLRYKIARTRDHIAKHHKLHTEWQKDVWNMNFAILLLDRIIADDYFVEEWHTHFEKWEKKPVLEGDHYVWPSMSDEERAEWEPLHQKTVKAEQDDWHNLWKFLDEHLKEWWD